MTKTLNASCALNIVSVGGSPVVEAAVLSQGTASSTGVMLLDEDNAVYLTSNASDIATVIDKLISSLNTIVTQVSTVVPGIGAALAPTIAELTLLKVTLK
jgi:hypothetical protein